MADDAYTFIRALGLDKVDIFSFSLGGFIAQALVVKHHELVRKLVLTGTGPAEAKDLIVGLDPAALSTDAARDEQEIGYIGLMSWK